MTWFHSVDFIFVFLFSNISFDCFYTKYIGSRFSILVLTYIYLRHWSLNTQRLWFSLASLSFGRLPLYNNANLKRDIWVNCEIIYDADKNCHVKHISSDDWRPFRVVNPYFKYLSQQLWDIRLTHFKNCYKVYYYDIFIGMSSLFFQSPESPKLALYFGKFWFSINMKYF